MKEFERYTLYKSTRKDLYKEETHWLQMIKPEEIKIRCTEKWNMLVSTNYYPISLIS